MPRPAVDYDALALSRLREVLVASLSSDVFQVEFAERNQVRGTLVASPPQSVPYSYIKSWETRGWVHCVKRAQVRTGGYWRIYRVSEWGHDALEDGE
jgi:hypothetical protein